MDLKSKSSNIMCYQEDDEQSYKANEFSDSQSQDQYKIKNNKHKKIKKYSQQRKSCNWGSGRPSKNNRIDSNNQQNQLQLKDELSKLWFGTEISMQLIIYLCKMGNMIPKVITGIPASKKKKDFIKYDKETLQNHLTIQTHLNKKKYSNQLKQELKIKHSKLLEYLQYSEDTTYMFLGDNSICQDKLYLYKQISQENKIGLEVLMKNLSPKFIITYKFIIQEYFQNKNINFDILIDNIVKNLFENQQNHKMIFDRQLIYELTKDDFNLINEIESNPLKAEFHLYQNSSIRNINFFSNTFNDEVEEITKKSLWIRQFLQGFIEILQNCDKNTQIEQKNIK